MAKDFFTPVETLPRFEANDIVQTYWEALRDQEPAGYEVPRRSALDPRGIQSALPYAFVLESITSRIARVRIAGSKVNDAFGTDMRGLPISALISPNKRSRFSDTLRDVFEMPAIARINFTAERDTSQGCVAQMILLPLCDEDGEVTRILGSFEMVDMPKRLRKRFVPVGSIIKPVGSVGHTDLGALRRRALQVVSSNSGTLRSVSEKPTKAHLSLVVSN